MRGPAMHDADAGELETRVLVLAPTVRDAELSRSLLVKAGIRCDLCTSLGEVCREISRGAGAALITAEAILRDRSDLLAQSMKAQPPWSDFPLIVLTPAGPETPRWSQAFETIGPMTLMKRPLQVSTLVSTLRTALRDRKRQYAVRDLLDERERTAETLRAERERYRVTLSSIGDAVIATNASGTITFLNAMAEALTGWPMSIAVGKPLSDVFRIEHEASRQSIENPVHRALREGVPAGPSNHTILKARDGSERHIDDCAA